MPSDLAESLDVALRTELSPLGFSLARRHRWVSDSLGPIRKIFELQAIKGGRWSPRWGFSVDFVPLLRGGRLLWKRTDKSAAFDLCFDPIDMGDMRQAISQPAEVAKVIPEAIRAAKEDYSLGTRVEDLVSLFEARSKMSFSRFSLENYTQTHLAWGLALIGIGKKAEGDKHLDRFCNAYEIDPNDPILLKARTAAADHFRTCNT